MTTNRIYQSYQNFLKNIEQLISTYRKLKATGEMSAKKKSGIKKQIRQNKKNLHSISSALFNQYPIQKKYTKTPGSCINERLL